MTFKVFRRGSARCLGLLAGFLTILICLYYISMGQPTQPPPKDATASGYAITNGGIGAGSAASMHLQQQQQQQQYHKNYQQHKMTNRNSNSNGNDELTEKQRTASNAAAMQRQQQKQQQAEDNEVHRGGDAPVVRANNPRWGNKCYILDVSETNITAAEEYARFDFQPEWIRTKEYWDRGFEERFESQKLDKQRPPLKVIVVPHSHNDPGWLKTFTNYFQSDSRQILNLIVTKMQEYTDMTFIWSEISFLQLWWDQAHPTKQRALKRLINSGRFEITTGGWVMTDEANVHLYAMLDQLIEGHQWLRTNLNVTPTVGWSIDPFGHGSTVPYLLSGSNFEGAIIQRIHYAWKQWFARQQKGDFMWMPYWKQQQHNSPAGATQTGSLLTHNMPFDIYSIKGSCGPHPFICLNFDFRKIPGEYTEYSIKAQFITDENIEEKAQLLVDQYARTASLFPHNVALIPVGDDFRYNKEREVDQQYTNYKKLIDHIMANKQLYKVDIAFGTPRDYFREIRKRSASFPTFKGDFFVYSDIFSEGRPAYWSGYFSTRPFYKILSADLEHNLRAAEILFTISYNTARQFRHANAIKIFEKNYEKIILARRNLGLFQHHDAITGTSKAAVMRDYGMRLFESIQDVVKMQEFTIELLVQEGTWRHSFLLSELERDNFSKLPRKTPLPLVAGDDFVNFTDGSTAGAGEGGPATAGGDTNEKTQQPAAAAAASFVVFNSLAQKRLEVVTLRTYQPNVKVLNERGQEVRHVQINPVWNINDVYNSDFGGMGGSSAGRIRISIQQYEVMFVAELAPLSLNTFRVVVDDVNYKRNMATVYCDDCTDTGTPPPMAGAATSTNEFTVKAKPGGDIQLENNHMRLLFDEKSGFMKTVTRKSLNEQLLRPMQCAITFAAYRSAQFHSGAYLFKTDPEQVDAERDVLDQYEDVHIIIVSGVIASDVTVIYGPFLAHTVRIFNTHTHLDAAIYIENDIDFEPPPKNREIELFMRFVTDIDNIAPVRREHLKEGDTIPELPVFYSDQNGFQYHKRVKVPAIGIEGNYFPITTGAFIQDAHVRLTLLTTHAQGAASYDPGQLEVMLDRRTLYDDYRGMGEGIVDSRLTRHKFWLLVEEVAPALAKHAYQVPSLLATQLANGLRYPPNLYFVETFDTPAAQLKPHVALMNDDALPCDVHLLNLRTLSDEQLQLFPSTSALFVLQRQGFDCAVGQHVDLTAVCPFSDSGLGHVQFNRLRVSTIESTTLTGMLHAEQRERLASFADITLAPMELRTFNVTFRT